jgi:hypothetical protein
LRIDAGQGRAADGDDLELSVLSHRVLVFLAEEPLLNEDVDAWREVAGSHLPLVMVDGPRILLAAEDELDFLFPLRLVPPDGHGDRHQHHHDRERDQQRRHRIPALTFLTL